jgi:hypothetical protein
VSEYQCYEFVALDRPLSATQVEELRAISTCAEISPMRFWNERVPLGRSHGRSREAGLLGMTIPDKLRNSKQQYRTTTRAGSGCEVS